MNTNITCPDIDGTDLKETPSGNSPCLKLHSFWNMEPVYIQIHMTVFVVPRNAFQGFNSDSPFEKFGRSPPSVTTVQDIEGLSKTRPIVLENVQERELEMFLQVIYPVFLTEKPKLDITLQDWSGVLRLSTMWGHDAARKQAVDAMTVAFKTSDDAVSMFRLGKEHSVARWMREAYLALIRDTSIGMTELAKEPFQFDWETIAKVIQAKYEAAPKPVRAVPNKKTPRQSCLSCGTSYFHSSGALNICLCRATAMLEKYFPEFRDLEAPASPTSDNFQFGQWSQFQG